MWDKLSMADKAKIIKMGVDSGLTHLDHIKKAYNSFADGGYTGWKEALLEWNPDLSEDINSDNPSYDYEGFYYDNPQYAYDLLKEKQGTHFTDKFKRPSHPTFSDESIYSSPETPGGHWRQANDKWFYQPSGYTGTPERIKNTRDYLMNSGEGYSIGNNVYFPTTTFDPNKTYKFNQTPVITPNGNYVEDINPSSYKFGGKVNKYDGGGQKYNSGRGTTSTAPKLVTKDGEYYADYGDGSLVKVDKNYVRETTSAAVNNVTLPEVTVTAKSPALLRKEAREARLKEMDDSRGTQFVEDVLNTPTDLTQLADYQNYLFTRNLLDLEEKNDIKASQLYDDMAPIREKAYQQSLIDDVNRRHNTRVREADERVRKTAFSDGKTLTGILNFLSPSQQVGAIVDGIQGEGYWESLRNGNSGLVSDNFAAENPELASIINLTGDILAFKGINRFTGPRRSVSSPTKAKNTTALTDRTAGYVNNITAMEESPAWMETWEASPKGIITNSEELPQGFGTTSSNILNISKPKINFAGIKNNEEFVSMVKDYVKDLPDAVIPEQIIQDYKLYLTNIGINPNTLADADIAKLIQAQYNDLMASQTGLAKGTVLWHGSPNMFDTFEGINRTGQYTGNMGAVGPGNYFSTSRNNYGLNYASGRYSGNMQPYLINDVSGIGLSEELINEGLIPTYKSPPAELKRISVLKDAIRKGGTPEQIEAWTKEIEELMSNEAVVKYLDEVQNINSNWGLDQNILIRDASSPAAYGWLGTISPELGGKAVTPYEFMLHRNEGIKSLFPHPSVFRRGEDGAVSVTRDWLDPRVNYAKGGNLNKYDGLSSESNQMNRIEYVDTKGNIYNSMPEGFIEKSKLTQKGKEIVDDLYYQEHPTELDNIDVYPESGPGAKSRGILSYYDDVSNLTDANMHHATNTKVGDVNVQQQNSVPIIDNVVNTIKGTYNYLSPSDPLYMDLSGIYLRDVSDRSQAGGVLWNDFVEKNDNAIREARDWRNTTDTLIGDKRIPLSNISQYYGIEDGHLKAGDLSLFGDDTRIIPIRNRNIGKVNYVGIDTVTTPDYSEIIHEKYPAPNFFERLFGIGERVTPEYIKARNEYAQSLYKTNTPATKYKTLYKPYFLTQQGDTVYMENAGFKNHKNKVVLSDENGNAVFVKNLLDDNVRNSLNSKLGETPLYPILIDNGRYSHYDLSGNVAGYRNPLDSDRSMYIVGYANGGKLKKNKK